jgi:hypothetical protein
LALAALRANEFSGFVELRFGARDEANGVAFPSHPKCDVAADAAPSAGNQRDFGVRHIGQSYLLIESVQTLPNICKMIPACLNTRFHEW